mgnify:CR=1 FL=1
MPHTPGPWTLPPDDKSIPHPFPARAIVGNDGRSVVCLALFPPDGHSEAESIANARLIAGAPELLATLETIANMPCNHGPQEFCPREVARAAIVKATKEEP